MIVIIGAGLSGLVAAWKLSRSGFPVTILEAKPAVGGRLFSDSVTQSRDFGAAWTWPGHDSALGDLCDELNLPREGQVNQGKDLMGSQQTMSGWAHGTSRIAHPRGTVAIAESLRDRVIESDKNEIVLNAHVSKLEHDNDKFTITYRSSNESERTIQADHVILAAPPKVLLQNIEFGSGLLPEKKALIMSRTPTWMEETSKVVLRYTTPWWRNAGLSGAAFGSRLSPLAQTWDNSHDDVYALAGFIFSRFPSQDDEDKNKKWVLDQFQQLFGRYHNVEDGLQSVQWKLWWEDKYVHVPHEEFCRAGEAERAGPVDFGHPELRVPVKAGERNHLFFAGTETEQGENGHMEGAVKAGLRVAAALAPFCTV